MKKNNQDILDVGEQQLGIMGFGGCTLAEYHGYLLKILAEIDRICRLHDIKYFLMYGSLIGAVRHNGFIPWDDDADIAMTRQEFNRFKEITKTELKDEFDLVTYLDDSDYNYTFPKLRLKNTTYIIRSEISRHGRNAGFFIDIILMDYVPGSRVKALIQRRTAMALHRLVSPGFFQSSIGLNVVENGLVTLSKLLLGRKTAIRLAEKLIYCEENETSTHLFAEIFLPNVRYFYYYDRYHFDNCFDVPFEGIMLKVPADPISLLHKCYFKAYIDKNMLIEHKYDDEIQAIRENKIFYSDDMMFIPEKRDRDRHMEIVFDCERNSSFYDSYYFSRFDKKENDICAVKERRQRERIRNVIGKMERNENIARQSCSEVLLLEYISKTICSAPNPYDLELSEVLKIASNIMSLKTLLSVELSPEQIEYVLLVFIISGNIFWAKRIILFLMNDNLDVDVSSYAQIVDNQFAAFHAVFEHDLDAIKAYLGYGYKDYFSSILKGIELYMEGDLEGSEKKMLDCTAVADDSFWVNYYLGCIYFYRHKDIDVALKYLSDSINCTNYMPQLQLAMDMIKAVKNGCR